MGKAHPQIGLAAAAQLCYAGVMAKVLHLDTVGDYFAFAGQQASHPLAGVIDLSLSPPVPHVRKLFGFYIIFLKDIKCGDLRYGCSKYDYEEGSLVFIAPGQVAGNEDEGLMRLQGHALLFHPDFLQGTPLAGRMKEYGFFSYEATEALHLSGPEREIVIQSLQAIQKELSHGQDDHTRFIATTWIQVLLEHCLRFYDRQFQTRHAANKDILARMEQLLGNYFLTDAPQRLGLPSVRYLASQLHLSPNYFGDLVKRETGRNVREHIHQRLIAEAKARLSTGQQNISEIAYALGFQYPHHFSRLFRKVTGQPPSAWVDS